MKRLLLRLQPGAFQLQFFAGLVFHFNRLFLWAGRSFRRLLRKWKREKSCVGLAIIFFKIVEIVNRTKTLLFLPRVLYTANNFEHHLIESNNFNQLTASFWLRLATGNGKRGRGIKDRRSEKEWKEGRGDNSIKYDTIGTGCSKSLETLNFFRYKRKSLYPNCRKN